MRADIDRALRAVRAATEFDWSWTADDLARFSRRVGWDLAWSPDGSVSLTTDFAVNRPDVRVYVDEDEGIENSLERFVFWVTDVVLDDPSVLGEVSRVFDVLAQRVGGVIGQEPDQRWSDPTPGVRWDLLNVVVTAVLSARAVYVGVVNPDYQLWLDEIDRSLEEN